MATTTFTDLSAILLDKYGAVIAKAFTEYGPGNQLIPENSIMGRLAANGRVVIGSNDISDRYAKEWGVHTTAFTASSYGGSDSYPSSVAPSFATASLPWKRYGISMEFDNLVRVARAAARGNVNALNFEFQAKLKALISQIEKDLSGDGTANSSKVITGVKAFMSTSNTYAGINQSTSSYWQARIDDASAASLASSNLETIAKLLYDNNGIGPNSEIWMSSTQWPKFTALYSSNIRYTPGGMGGTSVEPRYVDGLVDLPIYIIPSLSQSATTDEIWFCNLDDLSLHFLDHTPQDTMPVDPDQEVLHEGVPVGIEQVETGKDSKALFLKSYCQLVCANPRNFGAIINLAT